MEDKACERQSGSGVKQRHSLNKHSFKQLDSTNIFFSQLKFKYATEEGGSLFFSVSDLAAGPMILSLFNLSLLRLNFLLVRITDMIIYLSKSERSKYSQKSITSN